jgi:O-acetyl-ADP-ribose deacetylase (regulator of RNase III)
MPIIYKNGDMFAEPTEAIVNTVNCVGVMGKGVALEFKKRWPMNYKAYRRLCDSNELSVGKMFVFENADMFGSSKQRFLINFPTKQHWRSKSKLAFIEDGLDDFIRQIKHHKIGSVSVPPLGCGNGGLDWAVVKALIEEKLSALEDVQIVVFSPRDDVGVPEFETAPEDITVPRAMLLKAMGDFEDYFGGHLTRLSIQKITYFLQLLGVNFGLDFKKEKFGPYSEKLHNALKVMEAGRYIAGYSSESQEVRVTQGAFAASEEFLNKVDSASNHDVLNRLSHLIEGFESPYGMELLSSVHYIYEQEKPASTEGFLSEFAKWSDHKRDSFGRNEIDSAIARLTEDALIH